MASNYALAETNRFLTALEKNNNKNWFDENRAVYENCRAGFVTLVEDWIKAMIEEDPSLGTQSAKSAIFRINRDVRFSTNKSPYKSNFSAYLSKGGKKYPGAGYYLHIDPKGSFLASGVWMPPAPVLSAIRQEIDYNLPEFENVLSVLKNGGVFTDMESESLSRPPKGYEADNPAIGYLKQKNFVLACDLSSSDLSSPQFVQKLTSSCAQLRPFAEFLNRAVDSLAV